MSFIRRLLLVALVGVMVAATAACGQAPPDQGGGTSGGEATDGERTGGETTQEKPFKAEEGSLIVYSGRGEELVGPVIEQFEEESGVDVQVRYGDTAELAATILEEGPNSPADVFFAQDPGALGALADENAFQKLPDEVLSKVDGRFRSANGEWVGTTSRARVVAYNTDTLEESDLPDSILDFTDPKWQGKIGWAPTNGSFQAFVTALRETEGEDAAREWLEGIQANDPFVYPDNSATLEAVASGEIEVGFVNHYYLYRALEEQGMDFAARNYNFPGTDIGNLIIASGVGTLKTADNGDQAERFVEYLLSKEAQQYFAEEDFEYPLIEGVQPAKEVPPLSSIKSPNVDLGSLDDLEGTLELLRETGAL
ncbi:MAG TPA: iron ABC transporter substrate-binding protein [Rubrobacteraceae bacterium]|nr:iron ABC transporter substrate-binding protein [Rubrobacteraceae bacterium]